MKNRNIWRLRAAGLLALVGSLASTVAPNEARGEPSSLRSVNDVRPRIPDELDRPVRRETSSHRGWEVRADRFTIAANTSLDDARWAAAAVQRAWDDSARLADRLTRVHRHPDFGLNSLQVVIDGQSPRHRDAPAAALDVVGIQTQLVVYVGLGRPPLADQLLRLRAATALCVLHAAELDGTLPPWVVDGLAEHIARQGQPHGEPRIAPDRLASHAQTRSDDAARIGFLLSGCDAQYAPQLLAAIADTIERGRNEAARGNFARHRTEQLNVWQPTAGKSQWDRMLSDKRIAYEAWLKDPLTGQPRFTPEESATPELARLQREMLVVLKLQRRMQTPGGTPPTVAELVALLRDASRSPVATLDVDGTLLLSTDRQRMDQVLGWDGKRFTSQRIEGENDERQVLSMRLPDGRVLHGWLTDDPSHPTRPLVKFSLAKAAHKITVR